MHPSGSLFNLCFTIWCTTQCFLHRPHAGILQWRSLSRHPTKSWQYSFLGVPLLPITTSDKQPSRYTAACQIARSPCLEVLVHLLHWEHLSQPEWLEKSVKSTRKVKRNIILSVLCGSSRCMKALWSIGWTKILTWKWKVRLAPETLNYSQVGATQIPSAVGGRHIQMCLAFWMYCTVKYTGPSKQITRNPRRSFKGTSVKSQQSWHSDKDVSVLRCGGVDWS